MMPRKHYTRTKTGITIGCAYIPHLPPEIDEHTTTIQQALLNTYSCPRKAKWGSYLYVAAVLAVFVACYLLNQPTVAAQ